MSNGKNKDVVIVAQGRNCKNKHVIIVAQGPARQDWRVLEAK